jgi:hypothetical protein
MNSLKSKKANLKAKRIFLTKGTCSNTFFYLLNREFGHPKPHEERAIDPMAGGILQAGYQCGMLWGASMALGAEAYRRFNDTEKATAATIRATQHIMKSFKNRTKCIDCGDFTKTDFKNKWSLAKYMFSGKFYSCFKLAEQWAPEAIIAAHEGLSLDDYELKNPVLSCAAETIRKIGGSEEEAIMVAGLAGGLGLSGDGCGALVATIWKTILELVKNNEWKSTLQDPDSNQVLNRFFEVSDYKMECSDICGKKFNSIDEHSEFLQNGGCKKIIDQLALA